MASQLPPEAFTKELLSEAFNWLQTQPESLREIIQTPEHLVSLYRKHQRQQSQNDAPVSSKQFVSDLKDLAKDLEVFSNEKPFGEKIKPTTFVEKKSENPPAKKSIHPPPATKQPKAKVEPVVTQPKVIPAKSTNESVSQIASDLDAKTKSLLQETRRRFNLSSDREALRMLVAIGYEKISAL